MKLYHDSRDPMYRAPFGARTCLEEVTLRAAGLGADSVWLRLWTEGREVVLPMAAGEDGLYEISFALPGRPGLVWYYFMARRGEETIYCGNQPDDLGGAGWEYDREPPSFQITVYDPAYKTPEWLQKGIMYHIFPDRFAPAVPTAGWDREPKPYVDPVTGEDNPPDLYGGSLRGVLGNLPYLQDLGVTVIYFNPIFESPSIHKYDAADYERVDPGLGGDAAFDELAAACSAAGIRLVLDGAFSHTGADSRYFNLYGRYPDVGACQSKSSPYYPWYRFRHWPDDYECWWNFKNLPNVDENCPSYRKYIYGVARKWLERGASGWRLDVADELPMDFLRGLRQQAGDAPLIGEVWEDASRKIAYGELRCYCLGDTLDSVMNYPLWDALISFLRHEIDARAAARRLEALREAYPAPFYRALMNMTGSHDRPRALELLSGEGARFVPRAQRGPTKLTPEGRARGARKLAAMFRFLCAMPGIPCVYYGDEAGLSGTDDPYNRRPFPWGRIDAKLRAAFRDASAIRRSESLWTKGECKVDFFGSDLLRVTRTADGRSRCAILNRAPAHRRWPGAGEIPPESCLYTDCFT